MTEKVPWDEEPLPTKVEEHDVALSVDEENERVLRKHGFSSKRIGPPVASSVIPVEDVGAALKIQHQLEQERENDIRYRTCSWQKTAALLFSEYICLAIMSFPYSYSVLGLVPGIILTVVQAGFVLYTSLVVWEFCLRHPEVRDVTDIGQMLFFNSRIAWWLTAVMFILNNTFIMGLHVLVSERYLNTMSGHPFCTIIFWRNCCGGVLAVFFAAHV